ncbi:hypothetical protein EYC84_002809 [Monilinia fructicola]|uniref:Uncharacterized protein n=1 Tax=Monilinia fructicola TaxID=38448 RepID=A0A5M9JRU6_MONFR|nr:hypothetical protein EYC84_002809 [Monilinia fructicola]
MGLETVEGGGTHLPFIVEDETIATGDGDAGATLVGGCDFEAGGVDENVDGVFDAIDHRRRLARHDRHPFRWYRQVGR